jgi:hypothetical protein
MLMHGLLHASRVPNEHPSRFVCPASMWPVLYFTSHLICTCPA